MYLVSRTIGLPSVGLLDRRTIGRSDYRSDPKMCMTRNTNMCLYEQLVNIIQILLKFIFKPGGSYNLIFASFRSRYFFKRDKTKESSIHTQNS